MITTAVVAATLLTYGWQPEMKHDYKLVAQFDGFIPILGGNEGVVDTEMTVAVSGGSQAAGLRSATSELTAFSISFNGAKLPLGLESTQEFFPKTTVQFKNSGLITKTDAPDVKPPVRLPGLDVKRFPDITYLPLVLNEAAVEVGSKWTFEKEFDGAPLKYDCEVTRLNESQAVIAVKVRQIQSFMENAALEVTNQESSAQSRVTMELTGTGTIVFDVKKGLAQYVLMQNSAVSKVTPIAGGETKERNLKTTFKVTLAGVTVDPNLVPNARTAGTSQVGWLQRMSGTTVVAVRWVETQIARRLPATLDAQSAWNSVFRLATRFWNSIAKP
ncbi:MAG: hypothetical protein KF812_06375 [Fimbriimonadaceae bacterium]|nr:hypothetical protein [Fimbriimonadaceae bacterium]